MAKPIQTVMLIDDDCVDNQSHQRVIARTGLVENVLSFEYAGDALDHLRTEGTSVDVIFLDINMPRMNGFEFLAEYEQLRRDQQAETVVMMLTTSNHPRDRAVVEDFPAVVKYHTKPLTEEAIQELAAEHFSAG